MEVEVVESHRRVKTAQLSVTPSGVRVAVPASASKDEKERLVETLVRRYEKSLRSKEIDLMERAKTLAAKHGYELPDDVKWVDNQNQRWGSCTPGSRTIRISSAMNTFPLWVIDSVVAHELAHLTYRNHGPRFWKLANRYPLMERARGFLLAAQLLQLSKSTELHTNDSPDADIFDSDIDSDIDDGEEIINTDANDSAENSAIIDITSSHTSHKTHDNLEVVSLPFGEYDAVNGEFSARKF